MSLTSARLSILGTTDLRAADGRAVQAGAIQPKRLVLLAHLALASADGYVRRDTLLALFWPDLPSEQARHALRQSLHYLRTGLGRDVIRNRGDTEVGVDPERLWCDAREFEDRMAARDAAGAMALYRGSLLDGVFITDAAPELEQWLDAERLRFRRLAASGAAGLATAADAAGDAGAAIAWARRAAAFDPDDERAVRALVELLDRHGDRAGALRAYGEFEQRLRDEFGTAPSPQSRALRERLGVEPAPSAMPAAPTAPEATAPPSAAAAPVGAAPVGAARSRTGRRIAAAAAALLAITVFVLAFTARGREPHAVREVLAVGRIAIDSAGTPVRDADAHTLRALFAAELSQLGGAAVLSEGRLYELVARARGSMDARDHVLDAARRAGATELLDGVLLARPAGYRLELQRIDLASGTVRGTLAIEGSRIRDIVIQATSRIADAHRLPPPSRMLAALTSESPLARRSYERGMRALYAGDRSGAMRHFSAALERDPKFFAAAYYALGVTPLAELGDTLRRRIARAAAAADSAPERERLQIRAQWAILVNDPGAVAYAESLANRYPAEPEGRYHLGHALVHGGDFLGAVEILKAAIASDSTMLDAALTGQAPCRVCHAMRLVAQTYIFMDSMEAAYRWVGAWREASGGDMGEVVGFRAVLHDLTGRRDEALAAVRDSMRPMEAAVLSVSFLVESALRAGDFAEASRLIERDLASGDGERRRNGLWWDVIYRHSRGRLREAVAAADRFCAAKDSPPDDCAMIRASVLVPLGRYREAAAGIEQRLRVREPDSAFMPGQSARRRTWLMAHLAEVRAAARDTAGLARLADSVASMGRRSAYGRDRRLHHHVRGLLYAIRGTHAQAAESFRMGEYAPTYSLGQTRYGWARSLLALGRPDDAAGVLDPLRRRVLTSVGSYFSQAEVHFLLAQALGEAGRAEAAREHLEWAERAWDGADPSFRQRLAAARGTPTSQ
jgi:DNA-binding SARP family transcriptional activator